MKTIIIGKLHQSQMFIPIPFKINNAHPKHIFKGLYITLHLSIHLGMKSGAQIHNSTQPFLKLSPKYRVELCALLQYDG